MYRRDPKLFLLGALPDLELRGEYGGGKSDGAAIQCGLHVVHNRNENSGGHDCEREVHLKVVLAVDPSCQALQHHGRRYDEELEDLIKAHTVDEQ